MRRRFVVLGVAVMVLVAVACSKSSSSSSGGGSSGNIGRVSILNAMEPTENTALQAVVDADINKTADYVATLEANAPEGEDQDHRVPTTEGLPFLSKVALPPRQWETVGAGTRGGGLLQRYANRQQ